METTTEEKEIKSRDSVGKLREDIERLENTVNTCMSRIDSLTNAIVESAHIMGWPRDLLEKQGIRAFDKEKDILSIRKQR